MKFLAYFEDEKIEDVNFEYWVKLTEYHPNLYGAETLSEQLFHNIIDANQRRYYFTLTEHDVNSHESGIGLGLLQPANANLFNLDETPYFQIKTDPDDDEFFEFGVFLNRYRYFYKR